MLSRLRFVCLAAWVGLGLLAACGRARDREPEVVGTARFVSQVRQAILLLKTRDTNAYSIVTHYIGRIRENERSGMWANQSPPTYDMSDVTAYYSVTWCAATIAHDSFHSKLYHDYQQAHAGHVPDEAWTGRAAEQECMRYQLSVMQHLGAAALELEHAQRQADGHYVGTNDGWEDYRKRSW